MSYRKMCVDGDNASGICYSHAFPIFVTGNVKSSQEVVTVNGIYCIVDDDRVVFNCGHTGKCKANNDVTTILGKMPVLDGDNVGNGTGIIIATIHASQENVTSE